jgi:hypothetical protein
MCSVIQSKVPHDVSKTSRIPAIESIVELLARPIESQFLDAIIRYVFDIRRSVSISCFNRDEALIALRNELFSRSDLPALPLLITPILVHRPNFPTLRYIELVDFNSPLNTDSTCYRNWKLYQLHAFLLMIDDRIAQIPATLSKRVVSIIRYFIYDLIPQVNADHLSGHDMDDQEFDDQMDVQNGGRVRR